MKKIYLSGLVAVAIGALFTSCSKDNDLYDANAVEEGKIYQFEMEVAQKKAAYNEAFAKEFEDEYDKTSIDLEWIQRTFKKK